MEKFKKKIIGFVIAAIVLIPIYFINRSIVNKDAERAKKARKEGNWRKALSIYNGIKYPKSGKHRKVRKWVLKEITKTRIVGLKLEYKKKHWQKVLDIYQKLQYDKYYKKNKKITKLVNTARKELEYIRLVYLVNAMIKSKSWTRAKNAYFEAIKIKGKTPELNKLFKQIPK